MVKKRRKSNCVLQGQRNEADFSSIQHSYGHIWLGFVLIATVFSLNCHFFLLRHQLPSFIVRFFRIESAIVRDFRSDGKKCGRIIWSYVDYQPIDKTNPNVDFHIKRFKLCLLNTLKDLNSKNRHMSYKNMLKSTLIKLHTMNLYIECVHSSLTSFS